MIMVSGDAANRWAEFCDNINTFSYSNEAQYEMALTMLFRTVFGWQASNQETLRLGNHNSVRLDIALKRGDTINIVIEVKTHDAEPRSDQIAQLGSYLKLTKVRFGLLIGKKISIVYNDVHGVDDPMRLLDIEIAPDSKDGVRLADAIMCDTFNHGEELEAFCSELTSRLNINKQADDLVSLLTAENGRKLLLDALKNSSLAGTYNVRAIEKACQRVDVVRRDTHHIIIGQETGINKSEPNDETGAVAKKAKSTRTTFELLNIPVGSAIECVLNNREYKVADTKNKIIDVSGNVTTPSAVVAVLIGRPVNGYDYFTYGGRKLTDIRREIDDTYLTPKIDLD